MTLYRTIVAILLLALTLPASAEYTNTPRLRAPTDIRQKLIAPATVYVRKDGGANCTGLVDAAVTASGACAVLTIQAGVNTARDRFDASGYSIVVQVRAGTYTEDVNVYALVGIPGGGQAILRGDTATPGNVVINGTTTALKATGVMPDWLVEGFKFTSAADCINAHGQAWMRVGVVELGACAGNQVLADEGGTVELQGNYTISGNANFHAQASTGGRVLNAFVTTTLTGGTRAFTAFAVANTGGGIDWLGSAPSGAATGIRYIANNTGRININGGTVATFFPGDVAGVTLTDGTITGATTNSGFDALSANSISMPAWTAYTPTIACGTGSLTSASATGAYNTVGKQIAFRATISIVLNNTCASFLTVSLPTTALTVMPLSVQNTSSSIGGTARTVAATNLLILNRYDNVYFGADATTIVVGGVYESP